MSEAVQERRDNLAADEARMIWPARLVIGLIQGLWLWWLYRAMTGADDPTWPATIPALFAPLALVGGYVPVLLLGGVGRMRVRTLIVWAVAASAVLGLMAWHSVARQTTDQLEHAMPYLGPTLCAFTAAALFIVHHLILPADQHRRWLAPYPAYFDTAWKAGVQLVMSLAFVGVFWIVLGLGAALFGVIGLQFLADLISEDWFAIPVTCFVFAVAVHLTDVRDGLIRGVRTVALMLLSWLLPLATVLAAGFLAALPFTGLDGLFETGSAAALVLSSAAGLIILINTAYQDGREDNRPPVLIRLSVRLASVLLVPLLGIAFWALSLRIGQYGLTPDRIIASACATVGTVYAIGYAFAATLGYARHGRWMQPLERTNVWAGVLAVLMIVALFTPLLDPARLSVADQIRRLERGQVNAAYFDYRFLRFESGRFGDAALRRLAESDDAEIALRAREALEAENAWDAQGLGRPDVSPRYTVVPEGAVLPPDFVGAVSGGDARAECSGPDVAVCTARPIDLNGDGQDEVLVYQLYQLTAWSRGADGWEIVARYQVRTCGGADIAERLADPRLERVAPPWPTLQLGDNIRLDPTPEHACPTLTEDPA